MSKALIISSALILICSLSGLSQANTTLDTISVTEICLTKNKNDDRFATYSPDGKTILFESNRTGSWQVYRMDADGSDQQQLTRHDSNNRRPSWHPEGEKIVFESDRSGKSELYLLDLISLNENRLSRIDKGETMFASFSPDGEMIAVSLVESEEKSNIVLMDLKGMIFKYLTSENRRSFYPKWSKNGQEILYFSRKDTENEADEIYRLNLETGEEKRLTHSPYHNFCPAWSKDSDKLVFVSSMEDIRPEIYIMDRDGQNPIRITFNEDGETLPCWSPIDEKILITAYRAGNFEICELELEFGQD